MDRSLLGLAAISATLAFGYGSVFTLLAEIRERFGFDDWAVGAIGAAGFAAGFVAQAFLSRWADRGFGRALMLGGLGAAIAGLVGMVLASDLFDFIASRVLVGLGAGCYSPALRRVAITRDPARAGQTLGWLTTFDLAGFLLGPVLASLLFELGGLDLPFLALAGVLAALSPLTLRARLPEAPPARERRVLRGLLARPAVRASLLAGLAFHWTIGVFEANWAVLLADRGASQLFIGATMSLFSLPMLFVPVMGGRIAQKVGPMRVLPFSVGAAIVCMLAYGALEDLWVLAAIVALHSIADGLTLPANQLAIARASPQHQIASGQGLLGAVGLATAAGSALGAGWVYGEWGALALYSASAALMVALIAAAWWQGVELRGPDSRGQDAAHA